MPNQHPDNWTPERVETLKKLWVEGLSATQIAKELGEPRQSRNSVIGKISRLNLPKRINPRAGSGPTKPQRQILVKAKRVTLPPLPINGPIFTSDTKLLKSAAWLALEGTTPKTLTDLGAHQCRWPVGENPTLFCGCATETLYCAAHAKMAYRPIEKAKK